MQFRENKRLILLIILIVFNALMLVVGILTIPPNYRTAAHMSDAPVFDASSQSAAQTQGELDAPALTVNETDIPEEADTPEETGLSIDEIAGVYEFSTEGQDGLRQQEFINDNGKLTLISTAGGRFTFDYDPATGIAQTLKEFPDIGTRLTVITFSREGGEMLFNMLETKEYFDKTQPKEYAHYSGRRISGQGSGGAGLSPNAVAGTYEYIDSNTGGTGKLDVIENSGGLILQFTSGERVTYEYDPAAGTAFHSETVNGETWEYTLAFKQDAGKMALTITSKNVTPNGKGQKYVFEGHRVTANGGGTNAPGTSATARPKLSDFLVFLEDALVYGSPSGAVFLDDFESVKGSWKGLLFDDAEDIYESTYVSLFNLDISGSASSVTLTPDWYRDYSSFDESSLRDEVWTDTGPFKGEWEIVNDYALIETEGVDIDGTLSLSLFYEHEKKQYAIGTLTWWDGWENYIVLVRP